jgi:electron transfer flavoprotein alpha subunit
MSVIVFVESWEGKFKKSSFELVSYASNVAQLIGCQSIAVTSDLVHENELQKLSTYGADKILLASGSVFNPFDDQAVAGVLAQIVGKTNAKTIVLSNNTNGKALAARLSVKLKAALATGVSKLPLSLNPFVVYKKVFSGKAFAQVELKSEIKIITLAQNSFDFTENQKAFITEQVSTQVPLVTTQVVDTQKQTGKILITDADIVVSGGRGMKSPDNWGPLVELADLLGAATACSRPVSDEGWRPHHEHTGQTGKIIAPNLYFAIGISGATQHLAGVSSSKVIVAINTDKDAPIFEAARYGIVGDASKVLPKLVDAVKELKNK